jgi:hypothetical protein
MVDVGPAGRGRASVHTHRTVAAAGRRAPPTKAQAVPIRTGIPVPREFRIEVSGSTLWAMSRSIVSMRTPLAALAVLVLAIAVALPVLAAPPDAKPGPEASKPAKVPKAERSPEVQVTVRGLVSSTRQADGTTDVTVASGGKTLHLRVGPKWYVAATNPLTSFVGKTVTIVGEQDGDTIEVDTVDGVAVRGPGKPPWAGGWKKFGNGHPGWSQAKAHREKAKDARKAARAAARAACLAAGTCAPDEPDESEAPERSEAPATP